MADDLPIIFDAPDHTLAKHKLYRRYLEAWLPILLRGGFPRVVIVDGFAGAGEYTKGEEGSPQVAIRAILEHQQLEDLLRPGTDIRLEFIEERKDRHDHLVGRLDAFQPRPGVRWHTRHGRFDVILGDMLDQMEAQGRKLPPLLAFIDPFGPTGYPMSFLRRIAAYDNAELLINFAYGPLNRLWLSVDPADYPERYDQIDELYGHQGWQDGVGLPAGWEREQFFVHQYLAALAEVGWRGSSFRMVDERNQTAYFLIYVTTNHRGMKAFKEAAKTVAPDGTFQFSDLRDPRQTDFLKDFTEAGVVDDLKAGLVETFAGRTVPKTDLVEYTNWHPMALPPNLTTALKDLEDAGAVDVPILPNGRRRRGQTFPDDCLVPVRDR